MDLGLINGGGNFRSIALGDFVVTTIVDGIARRDGPYPTYGADQKPEAVAALMRENHLPASSVIHCFVPTLIKTPAGLILFDTGFGPMGHKDGNGRLRGTLSEIGHAPEDVSIVVLTHMHGDHIGGLMEEDGPAFPSARYVSSREEFDFWTSGELEGTPFENGGRLAQKNVLPLRDRLSFVRDGDEVAPGITAIAAHGHSPGHTVFRIESANRRLMLTADTANHYVASLQRPDWHVAFDFDKTEAAASRKRVFGMIADEGIPFIGHHMPFPSVGFVERMDEGFRYIPATYQFDL